MIKIGLVGEDPNDTISIKNLLSKKFSTGYFFFPLIKNKRGYQLDNERTKIALEIECDSKKPDIIIFIRDLDQICTHIPSINEKRNWYKKISKDITCKKTLLLNIYELEALILADINTFNAKYGTNIKGNRDVMYIKEPKELLMQKTEKLKNQYRESDCPQLFESLNFDTVVNNCKYFKDFIGEFQKSCITFIN